MAKNYYDLIEHCQGLRDDLLVVFVTHVENYGTEIDPLYRIWTTGKYFACITPNSVKPKHFCMAIPSELRYYISYGV